MKHGNQKYDFEPLRNPGGEVTVKPANIYSLKSALRQYLKMSVKPFEFTDNSDGTFTIKRTL